LAKPTVPALPRPSDDLPSALSSAINRRAWTLSHAAYEEYRKRMAEDIMIRKGLQHPEDWFPLEARQDALNHVENRVGIHQSPPIQRRITATRRETTRTRYVEDWEIVECLALESRRKKGSVHAIHAYMRLKFMTGMARSDLLRLTKTAGSNGQAHDLRMDPGAEGIGGDGKTGTASSVTLPVL